MTFRQFMMVMGMATLLMWLAFGWTVFGINPRNTNWVGFLFFYGTLFLSLIGSFSLLGIYLRRRWVHEQALYRLVTLGVRQAVAMSLFSLVVLLLQSQRLLHWWITLGLFFVIFGLEFSQLLRERKHPMRKRADTMDEPASDFAGFEPIFERKQIPHLHDTEGESEMK